MNKPAVFTGKDCEKFRAWWMTVKAYINTHRHSYSSDTAKINWLGSYLTETAQEWHQQRVRGFEDMKRTDSWHAYVEALAERFTDPAQDNKDAKTIRELKYKGDICQYLTRFRDLNTRVQWSGATLRQHMSQVVPKEIIQMVYTRVGAAPKIDEDFIAALQEAGEIYESMLADPALQKKQDTTKTDNKQAAPKNNNNNSKGGGQKNTPRNRQPAKDSGTKGQTKATGADSASTKRWAGNREALQGIDQADIDKYKTAKASCWRCGRNNHKSVECFAKKNLDGKELPEAPRVSGIKRKSRDDDAKTKKEEDEEPVPKKARFAATTASHPRIFDLGTDNGSGSEMGFR
jgi:hypothetical protein